LTYYSSPRVLFIHFTRKVAATSDAKARMQNCQEGLPQDNSPSHENLNNPKVHNGTCEILFIIAEDSGTNQNSVLGKIMMMLRNQGKTEYQYTITSKVILS